MSARRLDASALRDWAQTSVKHLIAHSDEINRLNVFPVADADTGTNMLFTMRSACAQAEATVTHDVDKVADALAGGALHGARGNSGVILSQILRGLADITATAAEQRDGSLPDIDGAMFGAALRHAIGVVVASIGDSVPGTIVSVLQDAATAAEDAAADGADLPTVVQAAADAAVVALDKTTGQLDVLAQAGVVDAGGRGLLLLLDAMSTTLTGHAPRRHDYLPTAPQANIVPGPAAAPQFEVMYLLDGCDSAGMAKLRENLVGLGESIAIAAAGGHGGHSVHVHTNDAGAAVEAGLAVGRLRRINITSLAGPPHARPAGQWSPQRVVLAMVDGDGAEDLFASEGAAVLRADAAGRIDATQLLHALVGAGADHIVVLPNGYVAAEDLVAGCTAAIGRGIEVVPVPCGSMVQGLAALAVHDPDRPAIDDGYAMARAAAGARHGVIQVAAADALTWAGPCKAGDVLGIAGEEVLIVAENVTAAGAALIDLLLQAGGDLVTVLIGAGVEKSVGDALTHHVRRKHVGAELVTYRTAHRGDALLIGVE